MRNLRLIFAVCGLIFATIFQNNNLKAQLKEGKVVNYGVFKEAIPWELGSKNYNAILELIQTPENKNPEMCDLVRVSFSRTIKSWDKDANGKRRDLKYKQKWEVDVDTLEVLTKKSKYKVYVDGEYVRDSIKLKDSYRLRGALLGRFYDYTDLGNVPLADKKENHNFQKHSYMPVSKELYDVVKGLTDEWPISYKVEEDVDLLGFNNFYLIGPKKEFPFKVEGGKTGKAIVDKDYMAIYIYDFGKVVDGVTFKKTDNPTRRTITDNNKIVWTAIYPDDETKMPWKLKYRGKKLVLNNGFERQYTIEEYGILDAIKLARTRGIISDPSSAFDYLWF